MLKRIAVAALLVAGLASSAGAVPLTYVMQGVVDYSGTPGVAIGDSFTLTFTVETSTPDQSAGFGYYSVAVTSASFSIGTYTGGTGAAWDVFVQDHPSGDTFRISASTPYHSIGGGPFSSFQLNLYGSGITTGNVLAVPTDVMLFHNTNFIFNGINDPMGHITSVQLVPEPSLLALLGAGSLALARLAERSLRSVTRATAPNPPASARAARRHRR